MAGPLGLENLIGEWRKCNYERRIISVTSSATEAA